MNPLHKLIYTLIASLTLLLAGCGGSSNTLSDAEQAKMQRAETQTAVLKTAYDAAVAALETLEDDTSDATQAEVNDAQAKLDALKAAITAAVDVSEEVKAMYPADALETRLTTARGSAAPALAAEQARMERAETQTTALKTAYDAAIAALETLEDDTSDATRAEVDDAQAKLDALKAAITAAMDVSEEVKAMYPADAVETRLTTARGSAAPALADEQARMARAETQTTALKMAYDEARAALDKLKDNTDDATQQEVDDAQAKLTELKRVIAEDTPDVSDEVKEMYSAETIETELTETEKLAGFGLTLERLRMAASKAIEDAGEEMDDARTAIEGAETAIEDLGIIRIQTGSGNHKVAQDVEKARMAYDTAKAAYDAAKEKYDREREAADTIAKMNALSVAAEQAKKDAQAAKMAAETARMKAETEVETLNRTALRYADGMYKLGDQSIMPDALKQVITITMEDGKVKTQTVGSRDIALRSSPITATPSKAQNALVVGSYIDSQDDTARLRLIDKYSATDKANLFHDLFIAAFAAIDTFSLSGNGFGPVSEENPHGTWNQVPIKREEGVFYRVTGVNRIGQQSISGQPRAILYPVLTAASLSGVKLMADAKDFNADEDGGIYSVVFKAPHSIAGGGLRFKTDQTVYLVKDSAGLQLSSSNYGTRYIRYNMVTVLKDVTFPVAKSYEHMNYGLWASLKEDGDMAGETPSELGKGFVRILPEKSMTADMPTEGTAVAYHGHWVANVRKAHDEGTGEIVEMEGGSKTTANFERNTITVDLLKEDSDTDKFASLKGGKISGNTFKGTGVTVVDADSGLKTTDGEYTGPGFNGAFFGPDAVEVGGVFDFTSEGKKHGELRGAFGGRKM